LQRYEKGEVLYWQGDPCECVFVVKSGRIKTFPISAKGKSHIHYIVGAGHLVGASAVLLQGEHHAMAEAIERTDVYVVPLEEFERFLASDTSFSMAVMKELAQTVHMLSDQVEELSLLDVHQRLERCLARLADEHGVVGRDGISIDLGVTHQEIADMIAANRSTVTSHLNKLKQEGVLWSEGRRLVLTLPEHAEVLRGLRTAVVRSDADSAEIWAREALQRGIDPLRALDALTAGIRQVDDGFARGELGLPEIMGAALAMERALPIIEEEIVRVGGRAGELGIVVIGTVRGDIHDIGKTMVSTLLTGSGFKVIDLGVDVGADRFLNAAREHVPDILAMSSLMTSTEPELVRVASVLRSETPECRPGIMVGGGAITPQLAKRAGADGYAPTARHAVGLAKRLAGRMDSPER